MPPSAGLRAAAVSDSAFPGEGSRRLHAWRALLVMMDGLTVALAINAGRREGSTRARAAHDQGSHRLCRDAASAAAFAAWGANHGHGSPSAARDRYCRRDGALCLGGRSSSPATERGGARRERRAWSAGGGTATDHRRWVARYRLADLHRYRPRQHLADGRRRGLLHFAVAGAGLHRAGCALWARL